MAILTLVAKCFWMLVFHQLFPRNDSNVHTWDIAVMVATFVARLEVHLVGSNFSIYL